RIPESLRTPDIVPVFPAQSADDEKRRARRDRLGLASRYWNIRRDDSASRSSPRATRASHSATSRGVTDPNLSPFQRGPGAVSSSHGRSDSRRMWEKPSDSIRALIRSIPSRSIQAFVAVLSEGPIIRVSMSFQVGFRPGSKSFSQPDSDAFLGEV